MIQCPAAQLLITNEGVYARFPDKKWSTVNCNYYTVITLASCSDRLWLLLAIMYWNCIIMAVWCSEHCVQLPHLMQLSETLPCLHDRDLCTDLRQWQAVGVCFGVGVRPQVWKSWTFKASVGVKVLEATARLALVCLCYIMLSCLQQTSSQSVSSGLNTSVTWCEPAACMNRYSVHYVKSWLGKVCIKLLILMRTACVGRADAPTLGSGDRDGLTMWILCVLLILLLLHM